MPILRSRHKSGIPTGARVKAAPKAYGKAGLLAVKATTLSRGALSYVSPIVAGENGQEEAQHLPYRWQP